MKNKQYPDQMYLKECFDYNEETGVLTWKKRPVYHFSDCSKRTKEHNCNNANSRFHGKNVSSKLSAGYIQVSINNKMYTAHRIIIKMIYGIDHEGHIDHINGIKNDNRLCNLRLVSVSGNLQNLKKANINNKTGFLGVSMHKQTGKYNAKITINGKGISLGLFNDKESAYEAYLNAKRIIHPYGEL